MSAEGHGHTVAAWVAIAIILLAFCIGAAGVIMGNWPLFWFSVVLGAVGGISGKVLQMMGYGQSA